VNILSGAPYGTLCEEDDTSAVTMKCWNQAVGCMGSNVTKQQLYKSDARLLTSADSHKNRKRDGAIDVGTAQPATKDAC